MKLGGSRKIGSDDAFRIRQVLPVEAGFGCWARWARVFTAKSMFYISITILALSNSQRGQGEVVSQMMFILYEQLLCASPCSGDFTHKLKIYIYNFQGKTLPWGCA